MTNQYVPLLRRATMVIGGMLSACGTAPTQEDVSVSEAALKSEVPLRSEDRVDRDAGVRDIDKQSAPIGTAGASPASESVPSREGRREWRSTMARTHLPKKGCFRASHPNTEWKEVPCSRTSTRARPSFMQPNAATSEPPVAASFYSAGEVASGSPKPLAAGQPYAVGLGKDYSARVSGTISAVYGWFPTVSGVSWEHDSAGTYNAYSLQINSNRFYSPLCNTAPNPNPSCNAVAQFVYGSSGTSAVVLIEYWVFNYNGTSCPSGFFWDAAGGGCRADHSASQEVAVEDITSLADLELRAYAASGGLDEVYFFTADDLIIANAQDSPINLAQSWNWVEFNIFGPAGAGKGWFSPGSTISVRADIESSTPTVASPTCVAGGITAETTDLQVIASSCCPHAGVGWPPWLSPGFEFLQSNANPLPPAPFCLINDITPILLPLRW